VALISIFPPPGVNLNALEIRLTRTSRTDSPLILSNLSDQASQAKAGERQLGLASINVLEVEHSLHQGAQAHCRLKHLIQFFSLDVPFQQVGIAQDDREGRAQFVRSDSDKVAL
jgi:hypothetical protein